MYLKFNNPTHTFNKITINTFPLNINPYSVTVIPNFFAHSGTQNRDLNDQLRSTLTEYLYITRPEDFFSKNLLKINCKGYII